MKPKWQKDGWDDFISFLDAPDSPSSIVTEQYLESHATFFFFFFITTASFLIFALFFSESLIRITSFECL